MSFRTWNYIVSRNGGGDNDDGLCACGSARRVGGDWMSRNSRAWVYSLITNSWREIEFDSREMMFGLEANDLEINGIGVFYKGVIYWHIRFVETPHDKMLCFDVCDETFHCLPLSDTLQSADDPWYTKWHTLSLWNESLALFKYFRERQCTLSFELWVMDDWFGSWSKQLVVGPLVGIEAALTFWTDDEILLQEKYKNLVSYNVHSQKLRNLAIDRVCV
ncbi:F-box associated domain [Parasponia andersonii]|uniref:F-box associated domain n=1 Tax=Parasponia andersonii TaxID=3476 RepID=A0A2P5AHU8_PARAD|nr:F-box associated domain [Parasponia andersonii]